MNSKDKKLLLGSLYAAIFFSVMGVVFGLLAKSQMVIFDGLYSSISVGLSALSLYAAKFASKNDWRKYPFGKTIVEPLVILVKYIVIALLILMSFIFALHAIFTGGREVNIDLGALYSFVGTILCFIIYKKLEKNSKESQSSLIEAEANQWLMDTYVSAGVFVAFLVVYGISKTPRIQWIIPYVDPLIVILICLYFIKIPLKEIKKAFAEILAMAPEGQLDRQLNQFIESMQQKYRIEESFLRVSKSGQLLWIEVDFVVSDKSKIKTIQDQDRIREEISQYVDTLEYDKWLTVAFTNDRKWAL